MDKEQALDGLVTLVVLLCIGLIAASVGYICTTVFNVDTATAVAIAGTVFVALMLFRHQYRTAEKIELLQSQLRGAVASNADLTKRLETVSSQLMKAGSGQPSAESNKQISVLSGNITALKNNLEKVKQQNSELENQFNALMERNLSNADDGAAEEFQIAETPTAREIADIATATMRAEPKPQEAVTAENNVEEIPQIINPIAPETARAENSRSSTAAKVATAGAGGAVIAASFGKKDADQVPSAVELREAAGLSRTSATAVNVQSESITTNKVSDARAAAATRTAEIKADVAREVQSDDAVEQPASTGTDDLAVPAFLKTNADAPANVEQDSEAVQKTDLEQKVGNGQKAGSGPVANIPATSRAANMPDLRPGERSLLAMVEQALDDDKLEVHMQATVALPSRDAVSYEALLRFRDDAGEPVEAARFLKLAEAASLMPQIDLQMLQNSIQMLKTLSKRGRDMVLFCNISSSSLNASGIYSEMFSLLENNKDLANRIVLEIPQPRYRLLTPDERHNLDRLGHLGFALCMDQIYDLNIDCQALRSAGFRFIKVPVNVINSNIVEHPVSGAPVLSADLADRLEHEHITLIATNVEREEQLISVSGAGVRHAQGLLFSAPRAVRSELFQQIRKSA